MKCITHNINVAATPVGFLPECNCGGVNFYQPKNPKPGALKRSAPT